MPLHCVQSRQHHDSFPVRSSYVQPHTAAFLPLLDFAALPFRAIIDDSNGKLEKLLKTKHFDVYSILKQEKYECTCLMAFFFCGNIPFRHGQVVHIQISYGWNR